MNPDQITLLHNILNRLNNAKKALQHSYDACLHIGIKDNYSLDEQVAFEGLCSRFARLSDIFIQKTLRIIDEIDMETPGTLRDRLHRAEKKGIIRSSETMGMIRALRNEISHEYNLDSVSEIYRNVIDFVPVLFDCIEQANAYCEHSYPLSKV